MSLEGEVLSRRGRGILAAVLGQAALLAVSDTILPNTTPR